MQGKKKHGLAMLVACAASTAGQANATGVALHVMNSGGFTAAYKLMAPEFTKETGDTFDIAWGPSMGKSPQSIPNRLARGEAADVVIMVGYALDELIKEGKVAPGSRVELADSRIGMAVKAGAPKPDISTVEAFKKTLLDAKSDAYSDSASGVYIQRTLFKKMGIEDQMKGKSTMVQRIPVGSMVAAGKYQLGFQQVAELLPIKGIAFVGKIPEPLQSVTRYAAGIPVNAAHPKEAKAFLQFMADKHQQHDVTVTGLDPVPAP